MLAVAILAAGESRRARVPKALLAFRGKTFAEHLVSVTHQGTTRHHANHVACFCEGLP